MNKVKIPYIGIIYFSLLVCTFSQSQKQFIEFHVEVDTLNDHFEVEILNPQLTVSNSVFNFVSVIPGMYHRLDFGRLVKSFNAVNSSGKELKCEKISVNKWKIDQPEQVAKIKYIIDDSFGIAPDNLNIYTMGGTGIENDHAAINLFGVIGYFDGLKDFQIKLKINYPSDWQIGTSLLQKDEYYVADTFREFVDNPILMGKITKAEKDINGISVKIYVYSARGNTTAEKLITMADDILNSAGKFIGYKPVDNYSFLVLLADQKLHQKNHYSIGALEHNYSSFYTYPDYEEWMPEVKNAFAHEFMHILTPLNLHSELIENFNFEQPDPSKHVWLYEGITEWAANIMQLRNGVIDLNEYLRRMSDKITEAEEFNKDYSLTRISLESFSDEGGKQYFSIYSKGALVAALLDIKLLELSNGKKGLKELFLSLCKNYGKNKPFSEKDFFATIVSKTYPEVKKFIDNYISGTRELPIEEYYNKIGVEYIRERNSSNKKPLMGIKFNRNKNNELVVGGFTKEYKPFGLQEGDVITKLFGTQLTAENEDSLFTEISSKTVGDKYQISVMRNDKELTFDGVLFQRIDYNILETKSNLSENQKEFRKIWMSNLNL